ncbi:bifunctional phosphoribosylaminoimidazolecarboxamide formyltransferase/IMP cyclohydrolase [Aestuariivirga litoralis]|uniref:bifunctional phosphoribosylaminoimidazolecarboxamide formyltransferase/IMP cyclohydrolase n=1 Tax=Aestuariivirga litoralis TaxID=2650924 RepID=UPI0018C4525A|nr:bifunctional phosphoribosylaminoimidazolecarboxamide formyltransferase/IMP cyclohydrolase [Aestuariivirga litoralis]MBG1233738.1 bifunctional phosphoribosylaminoimidazolecarboxamide formyltransferase/IMP cyclohydrolase [Aestuariivirga litoralis]
MPITRALLSVSDKTGLIDFAKALSAKGVDLISTGGTSKALKDAGLKVNDVSAVTGFPEIMDGRVKTLHPKIHGGLLSVRGLATHEQARKDNDIENIDLLVVNLYPFEETLARGAAEDEMIENIDIGGPAMIRAAAKNHASVTVIVDPKDYAAVLQEIAADGNTQLATRKRLAAKAYARTASYDAAIANWFNHANKIEAPDFFAIGGRLAQSLRYGENPHQKAAAYKSGDRRTGILDARQIQGKELSYNNINDADAALEALREFPAGKPACVIVKHANPCGVATGADLAAAYKKALACDSTSAFGGIIALNRKLDGPTAEEISKLFTEVIIAPEADEAALQIIAAKKNLRLLLLPTLHAAAAELPMVKSIAGGLLVQTPDQASIAQMELKTVTKRAPSAQELEDLTFAFRVAKHVKSNAIVFVKDGATIGIGAGQMSRIDSTRIAARKAEDAKLSLKGSALASDAFFPFPDGLLAAADAGATAIIQPGGGMRDDEVIKAADERGLAMVFTSIRHFRH